MEGIDFIITVNLNAYVYDIHLMLQIKNVKCN